jgi:hypothetical protein
LWHVNSSLPVNCSSSNTNEIARLAENKYLNIKKKNKTKKIKKQKNQKILKNKLNGKNRLGGFSQNEMIRNKSPKNDIQADP